MIELVQWAAFVLAMVSTGLLIIFSAALIWRLIRRRGVPKYATLFVFVPSVGSMDARIADTVHLRWYQTAFVLVQVTLLPLGGLLHYLSYRRDLHR